MVTLYNGFGLLLLLKVWKRPRQSGVLDNISINSHHFVTNPLKYFVIIIKEQQ